MPAGTSLTTGDSYCFVCCRKADRAEERNAKHPDFSTCCYPGQDWFPIGVIRLCFPQVLWCMAWLELLEDGDWPSKPDNGYTDIDPAIRVIPRFKSMWEDVSFLYRDIIKRLSRVPEKEYRLFMKETRPEIDVEALNKGKVLQLKRVLVQDLGEDAFNVLNYVAFQEKKMEFRPWLKQWKYLKSKRLLLPKSSSPSILRK